MNKEQPFVSDTQTRAPARRRSNLSALTRFIPPTRIRAFRRESMIADINPQSKTGAFHAGFMLVFGGFIFISSLLACLYIARLGLPIRALVQWITPFFILTITTAPMFGSVLYAYLDRWGGYYRIKTLAAENNFKFSLNSTVSENLMKIITPGEYDTGSYQCAFHLSSNESSPTETGLVTFKRSSPGVFQARFILSSITLPIYTRALVTQNSKSLDKVLPPNFRAAYGTGEALGRNFTIFANTSGIAYAKSREFKKILRLACRSRQYLNCVFIAIKDGVICIGISGDQYGTDMMNMRRVMKAFDALRNTP